MPSIAIEQFINAPAGRVYYAFTNATSIKEWLCDLATLAPHPGGRIYLYWNSGFYAAGEYISVEKERSIKFKWVGKDEPGPSVVHVIFEPKNDGTDVKITHTVPEGSQWNTLLEGFQEEWSVGLKNLAYLLETGKDIRSVSRPMLGIIPGDFNAEQAMRLHVPVAEGIRLDGVVDGMGAAHAGLIRDDVIVSMAGNPITGNPESLPKALNGKKGGDKIEVIFYRGSDKRTVSMELSKRPMVVVPWEPAQLAVIAREKYEMAVAEMLECFKGASEEQASKKPNPREWSAREVLAHLIHSERNFQSDMDDIVGGYDRWSDDWGGNIDARIQATVIAYKNTNGLIQELKRLCEETINFIQLLPPEFVARKDSYYAIGLQIVQGPVHIESHIDQIRSALNFAKV
jgi:uncharacterized protein YndB with AHSA1/START domain